PDIRNAGEFQQSLNGAIFAKGSVKNREDYIHIDCLMVRPLLRSGIALEGNQRVSLSSRLGRYEDRVSAREQRCTGRCFRIASAKMTWILGVLLAFEQLFRFGTREPAPF